jgi:hypothetical protein
LYRNPQDWPAFKGALLELGNNCQLYLQLLLRQHLRQA